MEQDIGKLILRLTVGILMLLIGVHKLIYGLEPIPEMFAEIGLPSQLAYLGYVGMIAAPLLVVMGVYARVGAMLMVGNMVVVFALAHRDHLFELGKHGNYVLELQAFYLFCSAAVFLLGAGRLSLGRPSQWN